MSHQYGTGGGNLTEADVVRIVQDVTCGCRLQCCRIARTAGQRWTRRRRYKSGPAIHLCVFLRKKGGNMVSGESRKRHNFRPDSCPTTRRLVTARAAFPLYREAREDREVDNGQQNSARARRRHKDAGAVPRLVKAKDEKHPRASHRDGDGRRARTISAGIDPQQKMKTR